MDPGLTWTWTGHHSHLEQGLSSSHAFLAFAQHLHAPEILIFLASAIIVCPALFSTASDSDFDCCGCPGYHLTSFAY